MRNKYFELAELLFEMELERISNDTNFHFEFNGWYDQFGSTSTGFVDDLRAKKVDVTGLAVLIKEDFDSKVWEADTDGLYNYEMPTYYGDYITESLEKQLAVLTKVGYQTEIIF
jgi:hypothetical protein